MLFEKFHQSVRLTRDALYSAFGSPGFGVTWSVVTFLSGLLYLIYDERKRGNLEALESPKNLDSHCLQERD